MNLESNQIFHIAIKTVPEKEMFAIFGKSKRLAYMWAANPRHCDVTRRNPLDRGRGLIESLDDHGRRDVAAAALEYMAGNTGLTIKDELPQRSDKQSVDGEIADLAVAMGNLASEIRLARADGQISTEELIRIKRSVSKLNREVAQLLDAAGVNGAL